MVYLLSYFVFVDNEEMANINAGIMAANNEPYYCSQQIRIPPDLPDIMKQFTKAAIRTQPVDPLAWAASCVCLI